MSLILVTRFDKGIFFAGDPFVFDNDGEIPQKYLNFNKFYYSPEFRFVIIAVGSRWVFLKLQEWLDLNESPLKLPLESIAEEWVSLNGKWKEMRSEEITEQGEKALRDISDSLFLFASASDLETIWIVKSDGQISSSKTFVLSGSGTYLVRLFLEESGKAFQPKATFYETLELAKECYLAAGNDLYVFGLPSIAILKSNQFIDLSKECEEIWSDSRDQYFTRIQELLSRRFNNCK